jgi:hypothetical protein
VHRWRKQHALVKLRLAGAQEDFDLQASHGRQLEARCETLEAQRVSLTAHAAAVQAQLAEVRAELAQMAAGAAQEAERLKVRGRAGRGGVRGGDGAWGPLPTRCGRPPRPAPAATTPRRRTSATRARTSAG